MKIGIDCRMLGPQCAGLGRYVEQLVKNLQKIDSSNQYVLFMKDPLPVSSYKGEGRVKVVLADIPWYSLAEQLDFAPLIKKQKLDLMHFPHWNVPLFFNDPFVVTIHDLIMYHYPRQEASTHGPVAYWFKDKAHRLVINHAVKKAKHILVTSEFTKHDVQTTLNVPKEKMTVTYQAPFQISDFRLQISDFSKYGITKPYVLYVGNAYPHKNLDMLLQAWELFEQGHEDEYQLVLVGKENYFYEKLKSKIKNQKSINYLGYVSDEKLAGLYKQAKLYVFPSLYEGFGLPPLEAMTYGLPVVSANSSCLPEVLGEGALYFDPENYEQMAKTIHTGLTDENVRYDLNQKAQEELKRYSWQELAEKTLGVYKNY